MSVEPVNKGSSEQEPVEGKGSDESRASSEQGSGILQSVRNLVHAALVDNAALKFVALVLALTVFILVHSEENQLYYPWVRVTYTQEDSRVLVSKRVDQVQISVRGTRRRIRRLQKQRLDAINIDLEQLSSGELRLEPEMFDLPDGIDLISVNPPSLNLEFDDRVEKMLTVEIDTLGVPARGFKVGRVTTSPSKVRASGAKSILKPLKTVTTDKINLSGRTQSFSGSVRLLAPNFEILDSPEIEVDVQLIEDYEAKELPDMTVALRLAQGVEGDVEKFTVEPATVKVMMYGPVHALEAIDIEKVQVYADITTRDVGGQVARKVKLDVEPKLSDVAYKIKPTEVRLVPVP